MKFTLSINFLKKCFLLVVLPELWVLLFCLLLLLLKVILQVFFVVSFLQLQKENMYDSITSQHPISKFITNTYKEKCNHGEKMFWTIIQIQTGFSSFQISSISFRFDRIMFSIQRTLFYSPSYSTQLWVTFA